MFIYDYFDKLKIFDDVTCLVSKGTNNIGSGFQCFTIKNYVKEGLWRENGKESTCKCQILHLQPRLSILRLLYKTNNNQ